MAVLRPKVLSRARPSQHLIYPWDGVRIDPARICIKTLLSPPLPGPLAAGKPPVGRTSGDGGGT